jgi:hypothetical protein
LGNGAAKRVSRELAYRSDESKHALVETGILPVIRIDPAVASLQHRDDPLLDEAQLSPCVGQTFDAHPRPALYKVGVGYGGDKVIEAARQYVGLDLLNPFFWRARDGKLRPDLARGQLRRSADVFTVVASRVAECVHGRQRLSG